MRQVILLRCCFAFVYIIIYIYLSQSTPDTSIAQLLPVLHWRGRHLRALYGRNPKRVFAHKHFNTLVCIDIFAGIVYCSAGGLHGSCKSAFFGLHDSTRVSRTPSTAISGGVHNSAPHWICSWARPNKWVPIEKQAHAMGKTKDLRTSAILLKSVTSEAPAFLHIP